MYEDCRWVTRYFLFPLPMGCGVVFSQLCISADLFFFMSLHYCDSLTRDILLPMHQDSAHTHSESSHTFYSHHLSRLGGTVPELKYTGFIRRAMLTTEGELHVSSPYNILWKCFKTRSGIILQLLKNVCPR